MIDGYHAIGRGRNEMRMKMDFVGLLRGTGMEPQGICAITGTALRARPSTNQSVTLAPAV